MKDLLNAIQDMSYTAAYWMGRRDACLKDIERTIKYTSIEDIIMFPALIEPSYQQLDKLNYNFSHEMGWS